MEQGDQFDCHVLEHGAGQREGQALIGAMNRPIQQRSAPLTTAAPVGQKVYAPSSGQESSYFAKAAVTCFSLPAARTQRRTPAIHASFHLSSANTIAGILKQLVRNPLTRQQELAVPGVGISGERQNYGTPSDTRRAATRQVGDACQIARGCKYR